jgi:hypothetical protein
MTEVREKSERKSAPHTGIAPLSASESGGHTELHDNDTSSDVIFDIGNVKGEGGTNLKLARDGHVSYRRLQLGP